MSDRLFVFLLGKQAYLDICFSSDQTYQNILS